MSLQQTEEQIHISELRYRRLFEAAQDGILILDADSGRIDDANPFLQDLLGYSEDELLGKELWEIGVFKDIVDSKAAFEQLQAKGYIRYKDLPLETKKGKSIEVEFISSVYEVGDKKVIQCNIRDITDRRKIEKLANSKAQELERLTKSQDQTKRAMINVMEDLEEAKARIEVERVKDEAMLASIGEGLIAVDNDGKIMIINAVAEEMLGLKGPDVVGEKLTGFPLQDMQGNPVPLQERPTTRALATGETVKASHFYVRKDKTRFPIAITATPIKLGGVIVGLIEIIRDITREEEIDQTKTEFISVASHQLRTPVSGLSWLAEALQATTGNLTEKQKVYVRDFSMLSKRLIVLVEDLLNISRIQLKTPVIVERERVDVVALIGEFVIEVQPYASLKKHTIVFEHSDQTLELQTSKKSLYNVLQNLVSNAVEYSPEHTPVLIRLERVDDEMKISIFNKGPHIPKEEQDHLFGKFYRGESAKKLKTEGTGLGLYIAKMIIEELGGKVGFESVPGKDTVFWVTLKL